MPVAKRSVTRPKISNPEELHKRFKQATRESAKLSREYHIARATLSPEQLNEIQNSPIADKWHGLRKKLRETAGLRMATKSTLIKDPKFNILNDRVFTERVYAFLKHQENSSKDCSMAMIDLDKFKDLNDAFGHPAGDFVLSTLSNILTQTAKEHNGFAGRFGGEELRIFIPENAQALKNALDEVQKKFNQAIAESIEHNRVKLQGETIVPLQGNWNGFNPTFTAGIASKNISAPHERALNRIVEKLVADSDLSLYIQKPRERGKTRIFDPSDRR